MEMAFILDTRVPGLAEADASARGACPDKVVGVTLHHSSPPVLFVHIRDEADSEEIAAVRSAIEVLLADDQNDNPSPAE